MFKELKDKARFARIRTLPEFSGLREEFDKIYKEMFSEDKSTYISFETETELVLKRFISCVESVCRYLRL